MKDVVLRVSKKNKIAVYGVCKNEEENILSWYEHAKDADYILLLDTGSTDKTVEIARGLGVNVFTSSIVPWSETIAKNTAMSLLPSDIDICVCLDLDQIITTQDWKQRILHEDIPSIANVTYLVPNGYKDTVEKQELPIIHSRNNVIWFGYRPRLKRLTNTGVAHNRKLVDLEVYHLPGNMNRFNDREPLYVNSFLTEEKIISLYSDKEYTMSVLCHIALSYFEIEDFVNFEKYYKKAMIVYEQHIKHLSFFSEYRPFSFLKLAKFLLLDGGHEEFLTDCLNNKHFDQIEYTFYIRLLVVRYLKYGTLENEFSIEVSEDRAKFIEDLVSLNYYEIAYFLSNIEWGKSQMELANRLVEKLKNDK